MARKEKLEMNYKLNAGKRKKRNRKWDCIDERKDINVKKRK